MSLRQNAFALLAVTALLAVIGDWALPASMPSLWRLLLALFLAGLAYERWVTGRAGLGLAVRAPPRWPLGRHVHALVEFSLQGTRPCTLEWAPALPPDVEADSRVRQVRVEAGTAPVALEAVARRLGPRRWPAQRCRIAGPLGLAWWPRSLAAACELSVVPDTAGHGRPAPGLAAGGAGASARVGAGAEVAQLRDYRPGDSTRAIDWKASARRGQLVSRDYLEDQHLDIVVALDVGRGSGVVCDDLDRLGHYVNTAARFADYALANDDQVGLVVYADRPLRALPPSRGPAAAGRIRGILGALEVQPAESNPLNAAAHIRSLVRRRCLVILLTDIEAEGHGGALAGAVRLLTPQHLPFVIGLKSHALEHYAERSASDWLAPYRLLAADEQRLHERRGIAALARGGVRALLVRPRELERTLFEAYATFRRQRLV